MEAELSNLEDRVTTLAMLCQQLRRENLELRQSALALKNEHRRVQDKLDATLTRVEQLIGQLPDDEDDAEEESA
ncbi:hypothetical protein [Chitinimonas sp. BJYL2]|uniref:hypothetical protein n=1 Tax=Chitinimonas sp. BJYL2 TaxID=2976696 RepID=UPI0022B47486|nr:hypothetical protein [Chitinimonas sp. BJYL2]